MLDDLVPEITLGHFLERDQNEHEECPLRPHNIVADVGTNFHGSVSDALLEPSFSDQVLGLVLVEQLPPNNIEVGFNPLNETHYNDFQLSHTHDEATTFRQEELTNELIDIAERKRKLSALVDTVEKEGDHLNGEVQELRLKATSLKTTKSELNSQI